MIDTIAPVTVHDYDGTIRNADFYITLSATDMGGSGLYDTFYRFNFGPILRVSMDGQPFITTEGINGILEYWSRDNAGNTENLKTITQIKLDKTPPFSVVDLSGLHSLTLQSSQNRQISIEIKDSILLENNITLKYKRIGLDLSPQTTTLQLDVSGPEGIYSGEINENPDIININVTGILYWIEGTDAAGNIIAIGGSELSPLTQYAINDLDPIFKKVYTQNERIGQTTTVMNMGYASTYVNQQVASLEICLHRSTFIVTADFSPIDSNYEPGREIVFNLGDGRYQIFYEVSTNNTLTNVLNAPITITATDGFGHTTTNNSFIASTTSEMAIMNTFPPHREENVSIDSGFVLQFNDKIIDDGLLTGHIYMTDSKGIGVLLDIDIIENSAIIFPVKRLKPGETYVIHGNPDTPANEKLYMGHYNEIIFKTGPFFIPLVPPGYSVTNASGNPLSPSDWTMKLSNGQNMSITWPLIHRDIINGGDLRKGPIMVSDSDSCLLWAEEMPEEYARPLLDPFLTVTNLTGLTDEKIILSDTEEAIGLSGFIKNNGVVQSSSLSSNTLVITFHKIDSIFIESAPVIPFVADGQDGFNRIAWDIPADVEIESVRLIRKQGSFPTSPNDGLTIYEGSGDRWYDIGLDNGEEYFYRLFVFTCSSTVYNFIAQTTATPNPEYRIMYTYGDYELNLMKKCPHFGNATKYIASACNNAVKDKANNGNISDDTPAVFEEFRLGILKTDDFNPVVRKEGNNVIIEIGEDLAFATKHISEMFLLAEKEAASDAASNKSGLTMLLDIKLDGPFNEIPILHAKPSP